MKTRREFAERHGEPTNFIFKGQYFDTGSQSRIKCSVCDTDIRFCYTLKRQTLDRSVPYSHRVTIGSECFRFFKGTPNFALLKAAEVLLKTTVKAEAADKKIYVPRMAVRERMENWRKIKRQALGIVREYQSKTGKDWLPEQLFELKIIAQQQPVQYKRVANEMRWYMHQVQVLTEKLQECKVQNV
jgi:hypothetical protein